MQRIQQLNGYLDLLPCLFYLEHATKLTKVVQAFDNVHLASHILRMVPRNWQDQYKLTGGTVPQSVCKLLEVLERIEKSYPTERDWEGPKSNAAGGGTSKNRMVSFSDWIPKKSRKEAKHCTLCKKHRGVQNTHNTGDCKKYNSDRTPKKASQGRMPSAICTTSTHRMSRTIAMHSCPQKLLNLKIQQETQARKQKRKHDYDSYSDDSDAS